MHPTTFAVRFYVSDQKCSCGHTQNPSTLSKAKYIYSFGSIQVTLHEKAWIASICRSLICTVSQKADFASMQRTLLSHIAYFSD
jgi:hypothetical protein